MAARDQTRPGTDRAQPRGTADPTRFELAGELGPAGARAPVPQSTERDPQQTHAAGPDLWGAPD
ncbi:MAG: hypothetical protein ACOY94_22350 [Bacillota bacterium]